ncbi:DUF6519 domain-containing protein [Methylocapsa polymorpha]|uniref:DUF6519 domain-containing protein n=1 Tax=Methylocapsa polymorpha TaxID=3080828 RepID=A0ABZ0HSZ8_9HYPH|nr:DUF6519 domain-containing protein [Methylocapsa sp. RX1]
MKGDISRDTFDAKKHYDGVVMQQGRVQLDADWNEQQDIHRRRAEIQAKDVVGASGAPLHDAGFQITTDGTALTVGSGRYYVDGLLCENDAALDYLAQPDYPRATAIADLMNAAHATAMIVYLHVWRRTITALEDPSIRETALGGPDTAIRIKTAWQVKVLPVSPATPGAVACGDVVPEWTALTTPGTGLMSARAQPVQAAINPCLLPPGAGYTRLENQLYRVEVHKAGQLATATFKWSRDNGSIVTAIEKFNGLQVTVHDLGRDETLGFSNGQWVEVLDAATELAGLPGPLFQIDHVDEATRLVVLKTAPPAIDPALSPRLRRWDSAGDIPLAAPAGGDGWITLEEGVEVIFEAGDYRTGDSWLIPARTVTGTVDWPFTTPQPPRGDRIHVCRLAVASFLGGKIQSLQDCRKSFSPLAETPPALHVAGTSWVNDDDLDQALLLTNGLRIILDGAITPPPAGGAAESVSAALSVTMEAPLELPPLAQAGPSAVATHVIALNGDIDFPAPNVIEWKPRAGGAELASLSTYLASQAPNPVTRVRVQVRLRGHAIWQDNVNQRLYVDGRALGVDGIRRDGVTQRVDLLFPSGDGRRASDLESWFYLRLQAPQSNLLGIAVAPQLINAGGTASGTVTLDFPASSDAGVNVALSASAGITVSPATINIPKDHTQNPAPFTISTSAAAANTADALITATLNATVRNAMITVQVVKVSISPAELTVFAGHSQQFSANVVGAAVDNGVTWSIQDLNNVNTNAGGTVNQGLYIAPATAGDFQIVATSTANPAQSAKAKVHVRLKQKDKDKDKEKDKDKDKEREKHPPDKLVKEVEKHAVLDAKAMEIQFVSLAMPSETVVSDAGFEVGDAAAPGRAFIRPSERPNLTPRAAP